MGSLLIPSLIMISLFADTITVVGTWNIPCPSCWKLAGLVRWGAPRRRGSARWTPARCKYCKDQNTGRESHKCWKTSISLVFRSLTMSLSNIKSLLPLSVKTTTRDFGDAFCRATSRPWANMMMISQLIPDTGYKYSRARSRPWANMMISRKLTNTRWSPGQVVPCCPDLRCNFQTWALW